MIEGMDKNKDGRINTEEYYKYIKESDQFDETAEKEEIDFEVAELKRVLLSSA